MTDPSTLLAGGLLFVASTATGRFVGGLVIERLWPSDTADRWV